MLLSGPQPKAEELVTSLRKREVDIAFVAHPAEAMAAIGRSCREHAHRASKVDQPGASTPLGDSTILLVVEPERFADVPFLEESVSRYFPSVARWGYAPDAQPRLNPLRAMVPRPTNLESRSYTDATATPPSPDSPSASENIASDASEPADVEAESDSSLRLTHEQDLSDVIDEFETALEHPSIIMMDDALMEEDDLDPSEMFSHLVDATQGADLDEEDDSLVVSQAELAMLLDEDLEIDP